MYELIIESRRFGTENRDGSYTLEVNEIDLAARSGLTRETVNREIKKLKNDGLVKIKSSQIAIADLAAIEKKLGLEI